MATKKLKTKKSTTAVGGVPQKAGKSVKKIRAKVPKISPKKPARAGEEKKSVHVGGEEGKVVLRIRVRAYESKILDSSVKQIIDTAMRYDAQIVGPVPLPTEIKKYTVNRASFIYKNTREQFEIRVHKRLIDIINPNAKTVEALTNLSLPSGVDIDVKML